MTEGIDGRAVEMSTIDDWYSNYAHRHEMTPGYSRDDDVPDPYLPGDTVADRVPKSRGGSQWSSQPARIGGSLPPADRGGPWHAAARSWLTRNPRRNNRECLRALQEAGHRGATTKAIQRIRDELSKSVRAQSAKPARTSAAGAGKARSGESRSTGSRSGATQPEKPRTTSNGDRRGSISRRHRARTQPAWHEVARRWLREHPQASNRQWLEAIAEHGYVGVTRADLSVLRRDAQAVKRAPRRARPVSIPPRPEQAKQRYCPGCGLAVGTDGLCRC